MKLAYKNTGIPDNATITEWLLYAKQMETAEKIPEALEAYRHIVKKKPRYEPAYERQMILFRKHKEYKKELAIIKQAVDAFTKFYNNAGKLRHPGKIKRLSDAISKSTGLFDKKGIAFFQPGPIGRWNKRKAVVERIINRSKGTKA